MSHLSGSTAFRNVRDYIPAPTLVNEGAELQNVSPPSPADQSGFGRPRFFLESTRLPAYLRHVVPALWCSGFFRYPVSELSETDEHTGPSAFAPAISRIHACTIWMPLLTKRNKNYPLTGKGCRISAPLFLTPVYFCELLFVCI